MDTGSSESTWGSYRVIFHHHETKRGQPSVGWNPAQVQGYTTDLRLVKYAWSGL